MICILAEQNTHAALYELGVSGSLRCLDLTHYIGKFCHLNAFPSTTPYYMNMEWTWNRIALYGFNPQVDGLRIQLDGSAYEPYAAPPSGAAARKAASMRRCLVICLNRPRPPGRGRLATRRLISEAW